MLLHAPDIAMEFFRTLGSNGGGSAREPDRWRSFLQIPLDRAGDVPLFLQIKRHLERLITAGVLHPGHKLPATRELARTLRLNRATVATAYEMLVAEGLVRAHVGQGTFVSERPALPGGAAAGAEDAGAAIAPTAAVGAPGAAAMPAAPAPPGVPADWDALLSRAAVGLLAETRRRAAFEVAATTAPTVVSFVGASPDPALFPTEEFRRALNRVVKREGDRLLEYHPVAGYPPLRRYLAAWLLRHGIEAREAELLVVNGSQQGLDLVARVLLDPGDAVLLEQPTYPGAIQTFQAAGAQIVPVPAGAAGLRPERLTALVERHRPKLLYCQPSGQNPTGVSLEPAARRALVELAARHRLPIVEDGFGGPVDADPGRPPLRALDRHGLVIHLGTFSKLLFPGLRLGWMVVPPGLVAPVQGVKQLADLSTSALLQAAIVQFGERRRLERHARAVRAEYARRRAALVAALGRHLPAGTRWTTPDESAFSLLVVLPEGLDAGTLLPRALERGIAYVPGAVFHVGGQGAGSLRLSFASLPAARIEEGVRRLGDVVREALRRRRRGVGAPRAPLPLV
jgi:2-aminoadipate transaminase